MKNTRISLIIPIYNGAMYLSETFRELKDFFSNREAWQLIFVDDGSTDETHAQLQALKAENFFPITVVHYERNQGKGHAVQTGLAQVDPDTDFVAYTDVELPYGLRTIEKAIAHLEASGEDVAIGQREQSDGQQYSPYRALCARIFRLFIPQAVRHIRDTQSGCKVFRLIAAKEIFSRLRTSRWVFDVEVLLSVCQGKYRLHLFPVFIKQSCITPKGGVSFFRHGFFIMFDLLKIHWYVKRGWYAGGALGQGHQKNAK